jgi:hypothetical protein
MKKMNNTEKKNKTADSLENWTDCSRTFLKPEAA